MAIDRHHRLWIIDHGRHGFGTPRLVAIDLRWNAVPPTDEGVQALITERPNAIGYVHWRALSPQVRALAVSGTSITAQSVGS